MLCGGVKPGNPNDEHIVRIYRDAVANHNSVANDTLEFVKIVEVKQQIVRGMMLRGTIECKKGGQVKLYDVDVWAKPSNEPIEVQKFQAR